MQKASESPPIVGEEEKTSLISLKNVNHSEDKLRLYGLYKQVLGMWRDVMLGPTARFSSV